jgi:hypothetical protein
MKRTQMNTIALLVFYISFIGTQQPLQVHIADSDAIDLARMIAHDEGYDVARTDLYSFDLLTSGGKPFLQGYMAIGFDINANHRNLILINQSTGQALDFNTCEIFDYPDLRPFQRKMISISKTRRRTPKELANDAGCSSPRVLTERIPISK